MQDRIQSYLAFDGFRSHQHNALLINQDMVDRSDLIIAMEEKHICFLKKRFPDATQRIKHARQWLDSQDIKDPFGRSPSGYSRVYSDLKEAAHSWAEHL